jgi:exosortase A-associated hydrolase 2
LHNVEFRYLPSSRGKKIFLAHYTSLTPNTRHSLQAVILAPPFGEEMNRSKRMFVLCARQLANLGFHAICFDYAGTGDSEGDWEEFGYVDWQQNLKDVCEYAYRQELCEVGLIALRLGAPLAAKLLAEKELHIKHCVFWDPIENGQDFFRQLMRTKLVAEMAVGGEKKTTKEFLDELELVGHIEIGGYCITKSLAAELNNIKLSDSFPTLLQCTNLDWLQINSSASNNACMPSSISESIQRKVAFSTVEDIKFWMQQEVTLAPNLLIKTCDIFNHAM